MAIENRNESVSQERVIPTSCGHACSGKCVLKVHVKDGVITRIESDDSENPQLRACVKGRAYRQRVYAPDRLKYPMKRVGARGEGKFERISWDEALDTIASELKRVKETYGSPSILVIGSGAATQLHGRRTVSRLLNLFGGATTTWGSVSREGSVFASDAMYGTHYTGNTQDDLLNSRLIIMWGFNPARTVWGTNTPWYLVQAKEKGAKIICIDPRFTESAATLAQQWIPIRPGTDAAMMIAMAYVMIKEKLHDQKFLDTYTIGFDRFREYVLGTEDGVPKTPAWAEAITGVPATTIEYLARLYATTKPAALLDGWSPGRSAAGEEYHRAAITLAAMTGNIGIPGGSSGALGYCQYPPKDVPFIPEGENPVELGGQPQNYRLPSVSGAYPISASIHTNEVFDAILKGRAGGYPNDLKLLYVSNIGLINQRGNINQGVQALKSLEFIVVHEQFMTPTAKFADILLPVNTLLERNDIGRAWSFMSLYYVYFNKAIDSLYESKSDFEICCELAPRLGIHNYSDKTEDQWLREIASSATGFGHYELVKQKGVHRIQPSHTLVSFEKQIKDPANNPFPTPSGRIEIYSQRLADMNNVQLPPIPKYVENWEGLNDPLVKKYPLQLITTHPMWRVHSSFYNIPWLGELETQAIWINTSDAQARGISRGDKVRMFNDRGEVIIPALVTERIGKGVVSIDEGVWYKPDEKGVDRGGCSNVLIRHGRSPGGAVPTNTCLVEVGKV